MLTKNINFKNFRIKKDRKSIIKKLKAILYENSQVIQSLKKTYKDNFSIKNSKLFNKKLDFRIIGMGGSTLGTQAIYNFLKKNIKKKNYYV